MKKITAKIDEATATVTLRFPDSDSAIDFSIALNSHENKKAEVYNNMAYVENVTPACIEYLDMYVRVLNSYNQL